MSAAESMSMDHASSMATGMVMPASSTAAGTAAAGTAAAAAATAKSGASQITVGLVTLFAGLAFAVGL